MRSPHIIDASQCIIRSVVSVSYRECMIVCQIRVCWGQVRLSGFHYAVSRIQLVCLRCEIATTSQSDVMDRPLIEYAHEPF